MTKQSTFKQRIRTRMKKTGESYTAARLQLLKQVNAGPLPPQYPANYPGFDGEEGDIKTLTHVLEHAGVMGAAPLNEALVYGLSGGVGFMYFLFEYKGHAPMLTLTLRSFSLPGVIVERALRHLQIPFDIKQTGSARVAQKHLDEALANGHVPLCTVDRVSLGLLGRPEMWIGQFPQQVAVIGHDEAHYWVEGEGYRPIRIPKTNFAQARGAYRKAKHRLITVETGAKIPNLSQSLRNAMADTVRNHHEAPFRGFQNNFGLKGLQKWLDLVVDGKNKKGWLRLLRQGEARHRALLRLVECIEYECTPFAGGRPLYASFLEQSAEILGEKWPLEVAELYRRSGEYWMGISERVRAESDPQLMAALSILDKRRQALLNADQIGGSDEKARYEAQEALAQAIASVAGDGTALFAAIRGDIEAILGLEGQAIAAMGKALGL